MDKDTCGYITRSSSELRYIAQGIATGKERVKENDARGDEADARGDEADARGSGIHRQRRSSKKSKEI